MGQKTSTEGGIYGGVEFSGVSDLDGYEGGAISKTKQQIIRNIAEVMGDKLGIPGLKNSKNKDINEIIKLLSKHVPDPREGARWVANKNKQVNACILIAKEINKNIGEVIDVKADSSVICSQVSDTMYSLMSKMSDELITSKKDIMQIIKNLKILKPILERNFDKVKKGVSKENKATVALLEKVHEASLKEYARNLAHLEHMVDSLQKYSESDIKAYLEEAKDFKKLGKHIRDAPGSIAHGRKIAYMLQDVKTLAVIAKLVDEALKQTGLSLSDYKKAKTLGELNDLLADKTLKDPKLLKQVDKYKRAVNTLYQYQYEHDNIIKELASKKGKSEGGVEGGIKLDKRVRDKQEIKKILINSFNKNLSGIMNQILASAKSLAKDVQMEKMVSSDSFVKFIKSLELIPDINERYSYFSITGLVENIQSKQSREQFQGALRYCITTAEGAIKDTSGKIKENIKDMKTLFEKTNDLIDEYVDRFAKEYGVVTEIMGKGEHMSLSEGSMESTEIMDGADEVIETGEMEVDVVGESEGAMEHHMGSEEVVEIDGSADGGLESAATVGIRIGFTLKEAINTIIYYFRVSKIRYNLKTVSSELKEYGKGYDDMTADAIAGEREALATRYKTLLDLLKKPDDLKVVDRNVPYWRVVCNNEFFEMNKNKNTADDDKDTWKIEDINPNKKKEIDHRKDHYNDFLKYIKDVFEVQDNIYKTVEALDTYLKHFAEDITADPMEVESILASIENSEIISEWYSDKVGDRIAEAFEEFPSHAQINMTGVADKKVVDSHYKKVKKDNSSAHYLEVVMASSGIVDKKNVKNGELEIKDHTDKKTVDKLKVSSVFDNAGNYKAEKLGDCPYSLPGNPYISKSFLGCGKDMDSCGKNSLDMLRKPQNYGALKNIISIFLSIGDKFKDGSISRKTSMSPAQIKNNLINYITYSAFHTGTTGFSLIQNFQTDNSITENDTKYVTTTGYGGQLIGNFSRGGCKNQTDTHLDGMVWRSVLPTVRDICDTSCIDFSKTDHLYKLIVKSMIGKIFTYCGMFNMLNRPINKDGIGYFSNLRTIIGGSDVKIIPEATELYVRLPLLAEYYRKIFGTSDDASNPGKISTGQVSERRISMLPEMDGVFSGLVYIIFDKAATETDGNYSETEMNALIAEINKIYMHFKSDKDVVEKAITSFIAEVNKRYGIINDSELKKYQEARDAADDSQMTETDIDYDIDTIDEEDTFQRPSLSDKFMDHSLGSVHSSKRKNKINPDDFKLLKVLREKIKDSLSGCTDETGNLDKDISNFSFAKFIQSKKLELHESKTESEKFEIVRKSISGMSSFSPNFLESQYIMFHEFIISGLNTLTLLHNKIEKFCKGLDYLKNNVEILSKGYDGTADMNKLIETILGKSDNVCLPQMTTEMDAWVKVQADNAKFGKNKDECEQTMKNLVPIQNSLLINFISLLNFYLDDEDDLVSFVINTDIEGTAPANGELDQRIRKLDIRINQSKLKESIITLFTNIKLQINKFRGIIPKDILARFENKDNFGSVYSLEEHLINGFLNGKGMTDDKKKYSDIGIGKVNSKIKTITDYINDTYSSEYGFNGTGKIPFDTTTATHECKGKFQKTFISAISTLTYVDYSWFNNFNLVSIGTVNTDDVSDYLSDINYKGLVNVKSGVGSTRKIPTFMRPSSSQFSFASNGNLGLVGVFNSLVLLYVDTVFDKNTRTVYLTSINKFVNGNFSTCVNNPDEGIYNGTQQNGSAFTLNPDGKYPLYSFTCELLNIMSKEKDDKQKELRNIRTDLNEIPEYNKEKMRANLPIFLKLFNKVIKKAQLLKQISNGVNLRNLYASSGGFGGTSNISDLIGNNFGYFDSDEGKRRINDTLTKVINGCMSLMDCIRSTLIDLNDKPKFFQTSADSIQQYKQLYDKDPFMPLSSMLYPLNKDIDFKEKGFMPYYNLGNDHFKFLYGTRKLLNSNEIEMSDVPGTVDIVKTYNQKSMKRNDFNEKDIKLYVKHFDQLTSYLINEGVYETRLFLRNYKQLTELDDFCKYVYSNVIIKKTYAYPRQLLTKVQNERIFIFNLSVLLLSTGVIKSTSTKLKFKSYPLQPETNLSSILYLTESSNQTYEKNKFISKISGESDNIRRLSRQQLLACNIIDLNIMPINIHAMMREIPLVNVYNYSITFDHIACTMLRVKEHDNISSFNTFDSKNVDMQLLINPCCPVSRQAYFNIFYRENVLKSQIEGLNISKYLLKEITNKALLLGYGTIDPMGTGIVDYDYTNLFRNVSFQKIKENVVLNLTGGKELDKIFTNMDESEKDILQNVMTLMAIAGSSNPMKNNIPASARNYISPLTNLVLCDKTVNFKSVNASGLLLTSNNLVPKNPPLMLMYLSFIDGTITTNFGKGLKKLTIASEEQPTIEIQPEAAPELLELSYERFNTKYIRNQVWLTNLFRVMRLYMRKNVSWYNSKVVSSSQILSPSITESTMEDVLKTSTVSQEFDYNLAK